MRSIPPEHFALGMPKAQLEWAQSVHKGLNGGIDMGVPTSKDTSGNFNEFSNGNTNGNLIRVSPSGGTDNKYAWTTTGTAIQIQHNLVDLNRKPRQPIGVHLVNSDKDLRIWMPVVADDQFIHVAPSDATAYATLYVF